MEWIMLLIALQLAFLSLTVLGLLIMGIYFVVVAPPQQNPMPIFLTAPEDLVKKKMEKSTTELPPTGMYA